STLLAGALVVATLRNTRAFASAAAQVIELRPADNAAADQRNAVDIRRIEREHTLHAFAERNLADGEVAAHAAVRPGNAYAFEILHAGAFALDHAHADTQGIAGAEIRDIPAFGQLADRFGFKFLDQVHDPQSLSSRR